MGDGIDWHVMLVYIRGVPCYPYKILMGEEDWSDAEWAPFFFKDKCLRDKEVNEINDNACTIRNGNIDPKHNYHMDNLAEWYQAKSVWDVPKKQSMLIHDMFTVTNLDFPILPPLELSDHELVEENVLNPP